MPVHVAILAATRELLRPQYRAVEESVAVPRRKKTLYRRCRQKRTGPERPAGLRRSGSFPVADNGDIRDDLRSWLTSTPSSSRAAQRGVSAALIAAAAASSADGAALYQQLSAPQHAGLMTRLRSRRRGQIRTETDLDAVADALIGTLLFHALRT